MQNHGKTRPGYLPCMCLFVQMYKAVNNERPLRLYTLMYRESSEEERYLWSLRREFQAFELLIREQAVSAHPSGLL